MSFGSAGGVGGYGEMVLGFSVLGQLSRAGKRSYTHERERERMNRVDANIRDNLTGAPGGRSRWDAVGN
ncbi:hypothetical protein ZHAS_00005188 [Anopheles sinensis]|uniref:Uncharacterized protein n=1 Tax=Anopheles sinensis TaxID=74873 RepID=A0A084VIS7_ANOSI|nr:hypothetical protein ZHAS_00005188 [Anopheles sinensis]